LYILTHHDLSHMILHLAYDTSSFI
jgi:hypothetical protein